MRFFCDHNVDATVARALRRQRHDVWTAGAAGLAVQQDDEEEAADLLVRYLPDLLPLLDRGEDVWIELLAEGVVNCSRHWE